MVTIMYSMATQSDVASTRVQVLEDLLSKL
jgi:hypothetical protein